MADTSKPVTPAKKKASPTPNRFMLSFGDKYADLHSTIVKAAEADDREPGEFMVRWLSVNFPTPKPANVEAISDARGFVEDSKGQLEEKFSGKSEKW